MENSVRHSETKKHTVQIDCRNHAAITGVTEVYSFHETEVVLKIEILLQLMVIRKRFNIM